MNKISQTNFTPQLPGKFRDQRKTADGHARASVPLTALRTLWFNTGTLCNIECVNCYIESSPRNDRLTYLEASDVTDFLDQIAKQGLPVQEIGFTGGEPFMNPAIIAMLQLALSRGFQVLVLTNAMRPMMRRRVRDGLAALAVEFPGQLTLRVSLDHYQAARNDEIRGTGSFGEATRGLEWLKGTPIRLAVAGRTIWGESEAGTRAGFARLFDHLGLPIDALSPAELVLFPEMDETVDVPEITTACWNILGKSPDDVMCATSRMVVKRRGAARPVVLACTLLPYAPEFELGDTLAAAEREVYLNHRHCAKFCVLGGGSCSGDPPDVM